MAEFDFDFSDFSLFPQTTDYSIPDFGYDFAFPEFNIPDFDFSQFDFGQFDFPSFDIPTFDPGQFDLGFDPTFDVDQYNFGVSDPFSIPTGDLNLPDFDLSSFLAGNVGQSGDFMPSFNAMGNFNFDTSAFNPDYGFQSGGFQDAPLFDPTWDPAAFDIGEGGSPLDPSMFGSNVGGGFEFPGASGPAVSSPEALYPGWGLAPKQIDALGQPPAAAGTKPTTAAEDLLKSQSSYYKMAPLLGLGQLGLGLSGGLMQAFGPQPKPRQPTDLENARAQAEIDAIRAKIDLEKEALRLKAEQIAAEGASENPAMEIAQLQAETQLRIQQMKDQSDKLLAELNRRKPLFTTDPRFSTLYDESVGAQQGLSPDNPEIQQMTQQIYAVRQQAASEQYAQQRDAILERANRLGTNPAAELAQINEAEQQAKSALLVEAQQTALAFAQSRLDPSMALLDAIMKTVV